MCIELAAGSVQGVCRGVAGTVCDAGGGRGYVCVRRVWVRVFHRDGYVFIQDGTKEGRVEQGGMFLFEEGLRGAVYTGEVCLQTEGKMGAEFISYRY